MRLEDLEIYKLARELNNGAWKIYAGMSWQDKKTIGDQFLCSTDSMGANIAEGFGRYHFLDKNKFNYNARGSLLESGYWLEVILERGKINKETYDDFANKLEKLHKKLNGYINSTKAQKSKE